MPSTKIGAVKDRTQNAATAAGIIAENVPPAALGTHTAPVSQTVYGWLVGARAGDVITGVMLRLNVAAGGTAPTTARFGLADATGKILVLSGNVGAAASWTAGACPFAFTAPYTVTAEGGYYACFVVNGTWGTTQPTLASVQGTNALDTSAFGSSAPPGFRWTGQTDLPAVASSLTITAGTVLPFYMAIY